MKSWQRKWNEETKGQYTSGRWYQGLVAKNSGHWHLIWQNVTTQYDDSYRTGTVETPVGHGRMVLTSAD